MNPNNTKQLMQQLRPAIDAALAPIAKQHGLKSLRLGAGNYSPGGAFTFKLEGVTEGGIDKDAERYKNSAAMLGLPGLGTEFKNGGRTYTISGINTTGSKVIADLAGTDRRFLFTPEIVKALTQSQVKAA